MLLSLKRYYATTDLCYYVFFPMRSTSLTDLYLLASVTPITEENVLNFESLFLPSFIIFARGSAVD